ncbi:MAG: NAD(P)/FAD-dependent oxidoreductase [Ruminiclostridium sp.]|nr:NAD(P)/FAD-dependent oxidoreductase [Ruminiclostridium sp.]
MKTEYDAIVVGGGIAGLTSAAYLSRSGARTLLVEKREKTGGLVNTFWHQGFAFDGGIRAFENSGILLPMLKSLGIEMDFIQSAVSIGIEGRWTKLASRNSLQDYAALLTELFPDNKTDVMRIVDEIRKVMGYMDVIYGIDNPLLRDDMRDPEYLKKTLLPWLIQYQKNIGKVGRLSEPVYAYLKRITTNDGLIDMIAQHFFKDTPTFFALSYFSLYLDYLYPSGGTGVLAQKVTEFLNRAGAVVQTGTSAIQLDTKNNEVVLSNGNIAGYKRLVWAADQKMLYSIISESRSAKVEKQRLLVEEGVGSDSILTVFMGVDMDKDYFYDRCGPHAFYTAVKDGLSSLPCWKTARDDSNTLLNWIGSFFEKTTYEISCPALRDSSLAPEGKTGIIVSTLFNYDLVRFFFDSGEYESLKSFCTNKIIDVIDHSIFPGLRDKLLFSVCATPLTLERETGNSQGAITGWSFSGTSMPSENRFKKIMRSIYTPIKDIVQCGQWSFSPSGLPVSILTGKLAADEVLKALR